MDVSVVIVSYNSADVIVPCINSVLRQKDVTFEILVVDNASTDNSLEVLKKTAFPGKLVPSDENLGYGRGCNLGFRSATGRYILISNPDIELHSDDALRRMVNFMESHPECGLMGPSVVRKIKPDRPSFEYLGEDYPGHLIKALPGEIAWVTGACMMIPYDVYKKVGGFDEDYFLYAEETDLALRIRKKGLKILYYSDVFVDHIGGASERNTPAREHWLKMQNGTHTFYRKHYTKSQIKSILVRRTKAAQRKLFFLRVRKLLGILPKRKENRILRNQVTIETSNALLRELTGT
jgi:GT2 family glycosyltransferase